MRIFVTVGNAPGRFDRLLALVDEVLADPGFADVTGVCQHGTAETRPRSLQCVAVLSRAEFEEELRRADVVITHAGVGSLSAAIRAGHRPIVMPRRVAHHEHVNDHQLEIARELRERHLISVIDDTESLRTLLATTRRDDAHTERTTPESLVTIERAFDSTGNRPVPGAKLLLKILALAAPSLDRLRIR